MVTNKSLTALENSQMALTLTVDAASIEEAYKAKINKYAKEIQMKGFRKGKAPISVMLQSARNQHLTSWNQVSKRLSKHLTKRISHSSSQLLFYRMKKAYFHSRRIVILLSQFTMM